MLDIDLGIMKLATNITQLAFNYTEYSQQTPMVQLRDGYVQFEINDVSANFGFDYEYITDPPYLADIGDT